MPDNHNVAASDSQSKPGAEASLVELSELATKINSEYVEVLAGMRTTITHAIAIGNLLDEVKGRVGHGGLGPWVAKNCKFKASTAWLYLRLARRTNAMPGIENKIADKGLNEADEYLRDKYQRQLWGGRLDRNAIQKDLADHLLAIGSLLERVHHRVGDEKWNLLTPLVVTNGEHEEFDIDIKALIYFNDERVDLPIGFDLVDYPEEEDEKSSWDDAADDQTYNELQICNEQTPVEDEAREVGA